MKTYFRVGDKVKVKDSVTIYPGDPGAPKSQYAGKHGVVTNIGHHHGYDICLKFDDMDRSDVSFAFSELEKL